MEAFAVLWREFIFFKRRFWKITTSAIMTPLLYLIAFGWGLGKDIVIEGATYMHFVMPGIIALSTMNTSFNAVAIRINISKLHEKSFEYYLTSPVNMSLLAFGHILAGAFRGMYAAFGYGAALSIESHYDMNRFTTYVMTPMSFLCGTFFSLKNLPPVVKETIGILPLSHTSQSLRDIVLKGQFDHKSILALLIYAIGFYFFGVAMSYREMN